MKERPEVVLLVDAEDSPHLFMLFADGDALEAAPVLPEARRAEPAAAGGLCGGGGQGRGDRGLGLRGEQAGHHTGALGRTAVRARG